MKLNKYSKKEKYSYTLGAFPTLDLIEKRPELLEHVLIHEDYIEKDSLIGKCLSHNISYEISSRAVNRLADKGNTLVIGVFAKYQDKLEAGNHVVLHEVSDMGNLGTIMRTMNAFDMRDLVLVGNVCDPFNPKTVRASMGSIFDIRIEYFENMEEYLEKFPDRDIILFMLSRNEEDSIYNFARPTGTCSLVFGSEASGLPKDFENYGKKVFIPQSSRVDSLNLPIAVSIGLYEFGRKL